MSEGPFEGRSANSAQEEKLNREALYAKGYRTSFDVVVRLSGSGVGGMTLARKYMASTPVQEGVDYKEPLVGSTSLRMYTPHFQRLMLESFLEHSLFKGEQRRKKLEALIAQVKSFETPE